VLLILLLPCRRSSGKNLKSGIAKDNMKQGVKIKKNVFSGRAIDSR
jgi:hypothetical protein